MIGNVAPAAAGARWGLEPASFGAELLESRSTGEVSVLTSILVADDDAQVRAMLSKTLTRAGFQVLEAVDGNEAMRQFDRDPPDLAIIDIVMPEKEGIETILELRREHPDVKIIAISGGGRNNPEGYLSTARNLGAHRTFTKPVDREELLAAVSELVQNQECCR
jgi:DNA-binding response OmpR family regulator